MDAITKVNETLNIIYTFLPKEILIIILTDILFLLYDKLKDKGNKNAK